MKNKIKIITIFIFLIFIISNLFPIINGSIKVSTETSMNKKEIFESISFSEPTIKDINENKYLSIIFDESTSNLIVTGNPIIPIYTKTLTFPLGTKIKEVECIPYGIHEKLISKEIVPSPEPVITGTTTIDTISLKNQETYSSVNFYPDTWFNYRMGCGLNDNERVIFLTISIFPVRYLASQNIIQYAENIEIEIIYEEPDEPIIFPSTYDFLVVTTSEFAPYVQLLVNHKISREISTKLVTLDEIKYGAYFPVQGNYNREKTKYFIKNAIENWGIKYVLLVGGSGVNFTICYSYIPDEASGYTEEKFPSDLYYADVYKADMSFASWDANGNHRQGEFPEDNSEVDLYPDVYIGRLPCTSVVEVSNVIDKIIIYENSNIWKDNIIVCGGDTFPIESDYFGKYDEGEYIQEKIIENMTGYNYIRLWVPGGYPDKGDKQLSTVNITLEINKEGADFVDFSGHGSVDSWATYLHGTKDSKIRYSVNDINDLANKNKLPILTLHCCYSCRFTRTSVDKCLGWAFICNPNGGSIATFGNTCLSYGYLDKYADDGLGGWLDIRHHQNLYNNRIIGEVWADTLTEYINNFILNKESQVDFYQYKTVEEWILFGDPTLNKNNNNPPEKPDEPIGIKKCKTGRVYNYFTSTTDSDEDQIYYLFDWGDGNFSKWLGPYDSNEYCTASYSWNIQGKYDVRVRSKDINSLMSEWSDTLSINMSRIKMMDISFLSYFIKKTESINLIDEIKECYVKKEIKNEQKNYL